MLSSQNQLTQSSVVILISINDPKATFIINLHLPTFKFVFKYLEQLINWSASRVVFALARIYKPKQLKDQNVNFNAVHI